MTLIIMKATTAELHLKLKKGGEKKRSSVLNIWVKSPFFHFTRYVIFIHYHRNGLTITGNGQNDAFCEFQTYFKSAACLEQ